MSEEIKYIDIKEFREKGYLQEMNRKFLHPLGLAMSIGIDEDGSEFLYGIWDYRDDDEGILYNDSVVDTDEFKYKQEFVDSEWEKKRQVRINKFGFMVQGE